MVGRMQLQSCKADNCSWLLLLLASSSRDLKGPLITMHETQRQRRPSLHSQQAVSPALLASQAQELRHSPYTQESTACQRQQQQDQ